MMNSTITLTARFEEVEAGCIQARLEELPGVITEGSTLEEAKDMLLDALREYLLALQNAPQTSPKSTMPGSTVQIVIQAA